MYEYEIMNKTTEECTLIFGYSLEDAFNRERLNPNNWIPIGGPWYDEIFDQDSD